MLAWYVTTSTLGSSIGSEASGRFVHYLQARPGWTDVAAYHSLFWVYLIMGIVNVLFVLLLTDACELKADNKGQEMYSRVPQEDHGREEDDNDERAEQPRPNGTGHVGAPSPASASRRHHSRTVMSWLQLRAPDSLTNSREGTLDLYWGPWRRLQMVMDSTILVTRKSSSAGTKQR